MKYSEFLQLEELLSENNLTIEDFKENPNVLNEVGGVAAILGGVAGLLGIVSIFGRNLIRLGIKAIYLKKLKKMSEKFKVDILEKTEDIAKNSAQLRQDIGQKYKKLKAKGNDAEILALKQKKKQIDKLLSKNLNKFMDKYAESKSKEVYSKIDELKKLKENQRLALKTYWDGLIPNIRIEAYRKMVNDGIITDGEVIKYEKEFLEKESKRFKYRYDNVQKKIESEKEQEPEENKKPENKEEPQTKKSETSPTEKKEETPQSVLNDKDTL